MPFLKFCFPGKTFLKYNGVISGDKLFCSTKCYKDSKNSIKEIEGGEDNEEIKEENKYKNRLNVNEEKEENDIIDILDI